MPDYQGTFIDLSKFYGADLQPVKTLEAITNPDCGYLYYAKAADFEKIPGSAIAYWASKRILDNFDTLPQLKNIANVAVGLQAGENDRFLRYWQEVVIDKAGFQIKNTHEALETGKKWFPYNKGGDFRKWYGNQEYFVNWEKDGFEIKSFGSELGRIKSRPQNSDKYFLPSITWSIVSSSYFGVRKSDKGFIFDVGGSSLFSSEENLSWLTSLLCSDVAHTFMTVMNPTLNFQAGNISSIPIPKIESSNKPMGISRDAIAISRKDWDNF